MRPLSSQINTSTTLGLQPGRSKAQVPRLGIKLASSGNCSARLRSPQLSGRLCKPEPDPLERAGSVLCTQPGAPHPSSQSHTRARTLRRNNTTSLGTDPWALTPFPQWVLHLCT